MRLRGLCHILMDEATYITQRAKALAYARHLGARQDAEDLHHDAIVAVLERGPAVVDPDRYAQGAMRMLAWHRWEQREREPLQILEYHELSAPINIERWAIRRERLRIVAHAAMDTLTSIQYELLAEHMEGRTPAESAENWPNYTAHQVAQIVWLAKGKIKRRVRLIHKNHSKP